MSDMSEVIWVIWNAGKRSYNFGMPFYGVTVYIPWKFKVLEDSSTLLFLNQTKRYGCRNVLTSLFRSFTRLCQKTYCFCDDYKKNNYSPATILYNITYVSLWTWHGISRHHELSTIYPAIDLTIIFIGLSPLSTRATQSVAYPLA